MQQKSILFSIVIPTYNRGSFITDTIQSVQSQSYTHWECIVVDDGSTDNTKELVTNLATEDNRIHYVFQENAERSAARNNGIKHSKGDFVCFLDSDDQYEPNYLNELSLFITNNRICDGLIVTNFSIWDGQKKEHTHTPSLKQPVGEWLFLYPVSPSRACVSRSVLEKYTFREDITIVEDTVLWVSIANISCFSS
jgi:glycosyltransferase involved in cell wall biosynthesis